MPAPSEHGAMPRQAWAMLALVYLSGLAAPLNQFKIPPVLPQLRSALGVNLSEAGLLMSIFSLVGVALALPSGALLNRIGLKAAGLLALLCLCVGSLAGSFAPDAARLLASRVVEGTGMCLMFVMAPAAIAQWFPSRHRGAAMGVWGSWVPVGAILMLNIAPAVGGSSWVPIWWAGALYAGVLLACFAAYFRVPPHSGPVEGCAPRRSWRQALKNRDVWLLGFVFCMQNVMFLSVSTFMPTFLQSFRGASAEGASLVTSSIMLCCAVTGALCGFVSDRIRSRRVLVALPLFLLTLLMLLPFRVGGGSVPVLMGVIGLITGIIPTAIFVLVQEVVEDKQDIGLSLGIVALGQNLGMFSGPALFGICVERFGWVAAGQLLIPFGLLGTVAALLLRRGGRLRP